MPLSLSRLLRPEPENCLLCGNDIRRRRERPFVPARHPEARRVLSRMCASCSAEIPWIAAPVCRTCGRFEFCPDCPRRENRHFAFCRCAVRYDKRMKDLLALYKYRGKESLVPLMAAMLACTIDRIAAELRADGPISRMFAAVTSVPLAQERLEDRGFNQAEQIARTAAAWYRIPYRPLLLRIRHTEKQSLKDRRSRLRDMAGNFTAAEEAAGILSGSNPGSGVTRILLVDDVYTTGSTVNECARALKGWLPPERSLQVYGALWARS